MTATLCAATFSNSYVLWHKRCVMLRFVAVPDLSIKVLPSAQAKLAGMPVPAGTLVISLCWQSPSSSTADSIGHGELVGVSPLSGVSWLNFGLKRPTQVVKLGCHLGHKLNTAWLLYCKKVMRHLGIWFFWVLKVHKQEIFQNFLWYKTKTLLEARGQD